MSARRGTTIDVEVGVRLRHRRQQLKLSQSDLAARLNIAQAQLAKYESGANRLSVGRLVECAAALDVPLTYFVDDDIGKVAGAAKSGQPLTPVENTMVTHFRMLSQPSAQQILQLIVRFSELEK